VWQLISDGCGYGPGSLSLWKWGDIRPGSCINRLTAKYAILRIPPACPRLWCMQIWLPKKNSSARDH